MQDSESHEVQQHFRPETCPARSRNALRVCCRDTGWPRARGPRRLGCSVCAHSSALLLSRENHLTSSCATFSGVFFFFFSICKRFYQSCFSGLNEVTNTQSAFRFAFHSTNRRSQCTSQPREQRGGLAQPFPITLAALTVFGLWHLQTIWDFFFWGGAFVAPHHRAILPSGHGNSGPHCP